MSIAYFPRDRSLLVFYFILLLLRIQVYYLQYLHTT